MFAVLRTGGKQYKVAKDDVLDVERLDGEAGGRITFGEVLMLGGDTLKYGAPVIDGASVAAEIVVQKRASKIVVFKKKCRKDTHLKRGHRQNLTTVKITGIKTG